jgi:hypothetical protein
MNVSTIARLQALVRVLVGTALTVAPGRAGAGWIGPVAGKSPTTVYSRALGARDAVMGLGVLRTASDPDALRPWLLAGIVADAVDTAATLEALDDLPKMGRTVAPLIAGGSALLGLGLLVKLG